MHDRAERFPAKTLSTATLKPRSRARRSDPDLRTQPLQLARYRSFYVSLAAGSAAYALLAGVIAAPLFR